MRHFYESIFVMLLVFTLNACEKEGHGDQTALDERSGRLSVSITDAPFDDDDIVGVYITVAGIEVDGEFQPLLAKRNTIELSALVNGKTEPLGLENKFEVGSYTSLGLKLDMFRDLNGNAPGCYVLLKNGEKVDLSYDSPNFVTIPFAEVFMVKPNKSTKLVIDFDLRKAIRRDSQQRYTFRSLDNLVKSTRVVPKHKVGLISGRATLEAVAPETEKLIVYAYESGTYDAERERNTNFEGALTSASIDREGKFKLAYLLEGTYELVVANFAINEDGNAAFDALLIADAGIGQPTREVVVSSKTEVSITMKIGGVLP